MNVEGKNWVMKDCLSIVIICRNVRWMSDSFEIQIKLGTLELALSLELSVSFQSAFCLLAQRIVSLSSFFRSKANTISRLKNICCHYTAFCMCCLLLVFFCWFDELTNDCWLPDLWLFFPSLLSSRLISSHWIDIGKTLFFLFVVDCLNDDCLFIMRWMLTFSCFLKLKIDKLCDQMMRLVSFSFSSPVYCISTHWYSI